MFSRVCLEIAGALFGVHELMWEVCFAIQLCHTTSVVSPRVLNGKSPAYLLNTLAVVYVCHIRGKSIARRKDGRLSTLA
jgi:hypothetical protein